MLERPACSQEPFTSLNQREVPESEAAIASLFKMLKDSVEWAVWQEKGYKDEIVQTAYLYEMLMKTMSALPRKMHIRT